MNSKPRDYFGLLSWKCDRLTEKAQKYLDSLPPISNDDCIQGIWEKAQEIFAKNDEDFDKVPWWVADTMDYHMPYTNIPKDGSLGFSFGFSIVSFEAHLRNLLEIAQNRETKELDFPFKEVITKEDMRDLK